MTSINFFTPVTYNNSIKTTSQKALETVDEFFYLGTKHRVKILTTGEAVLDRQGRHRSLTNTAVKVALYCTVALPLVGLLIKAALRSYLQISSIQLDLSYSPNKEIEKKLPSDILANIGSFLSHKDQGKLAQSAIFTRDVAIEAQSEIATLKEEIQALPAGPLAHEDFQRLLNGLNASPIAGHPKHWVPVMDTLMDRLLAPLKAEIQALPAGPVNNEDFQRLLVELITSPAIDYPKYWAPVMNTLLSHLARGTINEEIQNHATIANLLATSEQPISPDQIYKFCRHLGLNQLSILRPWVSYRALEQYTEKPRLDSESVKKALKEYLTKAATKDIKAFNNECSLPRVIMVQNNGFSLPNERTLKFQVTIIDPREWFGLEGEDSSLWQQPGAVNHAARIPELLLEVLWARIQHLNNACMDRPFTVGMMGRAEAQLPHNFTLTLAKQITNANIFLDYNSTVDGRELKWPYARVIGSLRDKEQNALAQQYPRAVEIRNRR